MAESGSYDNVRTAVILWFFEEIDYTIPCFDVLHVRLHRCRIKIVGDDGEDGERMDAFINSATPIHRYACRLRIIPYESCEVQVRLALTNVCDVSAICHRDRRLTRTISIVPCQFLMTTFQLFGNGR